MENNQEQNNKKIHLILCIGILIIAILTIILGLLIGRIQKLTQSPTIVIDTVTNVIEIEKIKYEIEEQKENVEQYKQEYKYEKEQANIINDSAAIKLFYQLVSE